MSQSAGIVGTIAVAALAAMVVGAATGALIAFVVVVVEQALRAVQGGTP